MGKQPKDRFGYDWTGKEVQSKAGAFRDSAEGKGRYDLVSPFALHRLVIVYEKGAKRRGARNWEKGFEFSRAISSTLRHIVQFMMGMKDEDHLAHAAWNLFSLMHFEDMNRVELDDMPHYLKEEKNKK